MPPCGRSCWPADCTISTKHGAVAQLGERCVRNAEVEGSIPFRSTNAREWPELPAIFLCEIFAPPERVAHTLAGRTMIHSSDHWRGQRRILLAALLE